MKRFLPIVGLCLGLGLLQSCVNAPSNNPDNGQGGGGSPAGSGTSDCSKLDLNGDWIDHGSNDRRVHITQSGGSISIMYLDSPYFTCDLRDQGGVLSSTQTDLTGQISGCNLTGQTSVCSHACNTSGNNSGNSSGNTSGNSSGGCGIINADATGTLDPTNPNHIEATWFNSDTNSNVTFSLDRKGCTLRQGKDYLLNSNLTDNPNFNRTNSADSYAAQYKADTPAGSPPLILIADVSGGVVSDVISDGQPPLVFVDLPNGNSIGYQLFGDGSAPLVKVGDAVTLLTPIGTLARDASTSSYAFQVSGFGPQSSKPNVSPDCVEK